MSWLYQDCHSREWTYTEEQGHQLQNQGVHYGTVDQMTKLGLTVEIRLPSQGKSAQEEGRRLWEERPTEVNLVTHVEKMYKMNKMEAGRRRRKSLRRHRLGMYHIPDRTQPLYATPYIRTAEPSVH